MADWILGRDEVRAIRDARASLLAAAASGVPGSLERAVAEAVAVMWEADFSRTTICSLVSAAVESGLPRGRSHADRLASVRSWSDRAGTLADAIAAGPGADRSVGPQRARVVG